MASPNTLCDFPPELLTVSGVLPADYRNGAFAGRVWRPDLGGPSVVKIENDEVLDITQTFPTVSALLDEVHPADALRSAPGEAIGSISAILETTMEDSIGNNKPYLL